MILRLKSLFTGCQKIGMHGLRTGITGAIISGLGMSFLIIRELLN